MPRGPTFGGDALQATARYAARAPISLLSLHYDKENQQVAYRYTSAYDHREHIERLSAHEFIARLSTHIPNRYEHSIRYWGHYANRARGARRVKMTETAKITIEEKTLPTRWKMQWQQLLRRIFHVTLTCPHCDSEMKIIAVITESEPIHKILSHLKSKKIDPRAGPFADKAA